MEDAPRALASYDAALRLNPVSVQALFRAAEMHKLAEDHAGAAELFCRALAAATTNSPPHSPLAVNGHGGSYPLNTSEALGEAWGGLAHCYLMIEELGKAYTCYQQAIAHQGQNQPTLWYGIGILYDRYGSLEHAEEAFASVIKMDASASGPPLFATWTELLQTLTAPTRSTSASASSTSSKRTRAPASLSVVALLDSADPAVLPVHPRQPAAAGDGDRHLVPDRARLRAAAGVRRGQGRVRPRPAGQPEPRQGPAAARRPVPPPSRVLLRRGQVGRDPHQEPRERSVSRTLPR